MSGPKHTPTVPRLADFLKACADDLEAEINGRYPLYRRQQYAWAQARWERDMEPVRATRAALREAGETE